LAKLMASDLGPRERVNGIIPRPIETPALKGVFDMRPEIFDVAVNSTRMKRVG
jgi:enoyl-[acyl-carrier-protein] reductase (NADH)